MGIYTSSSVPGDRQTARKYIILKLTGLDGRSGGHASRDLYYTEAAVLPTHLSSLHSPT